MTSYKITDDTAALAATQPVADAEVEDVCRRLSLEAEARHDVEYADLYDPDLTRTMETAATLIRSLHARAVRAEADLADTQRINEALAQELDMVEQEGCAVDDQIRRMDDELKALKAELTAARAERDEARALMSEAKEALKPFAADQLPGDSRRSLKIRTSRDGTLVALTDMEAAREHARATLARLGAATGNTAPEQDQGDR